MPGQGTPIIVGGGIALGSPAVIGNFLKLSSITPPAANVSTRLLETATGIEANGDGTNSTAIGDGADANGTNHIAIGTNTITAAAATRHLAIGDSINLGATGGNNAVVIGSATFSGGFIGSDCTGVGYGQGWATASSTSTIIGANITLNGSGNVIVGANASSSSSSNTIIGSSAGAAGARSICIGNAAAGTGTTTDLIVVGANSTFANLSNIIAIGGGITQAGLSTGTIVLGHNNNGGGGFSSILLLGGADTHTSGTSVPAWTNRYKNAAGTNVAAGNVTFIAPRATGTATGGAFVFQTAPVTGSGTTLQTAQTVFRIESTSNIAFTGAGVAPSYGSGVGVFFLANAGTNPSANPTGGGILYVNAGALTYRGSAGTVTVVAPA